jgi:hypothetical protein
VLKLQTNPATIQVVRLFGLARDPHLKLCEAEVEVEVEVKFGFSVVCSSTHIGLFPVRFCASPLRIFVVPFFFAACCIHLTSQ